MAKQVQKRRPGLWRRARVWLGGGRPGQGGGSQDLKLRFLEFQHLLRANNEVLSLIAELQQAQEHPGGLGLDLLRSRYIAASAQTYRMIRHLNLLSGGRYPGLNDAFNRVRAEIDGILARETQANLGRMVVDLGDVAPGMEHLVGPKAANLARAAAAGLPVPPGAVVTTEAFRAFADLGGLRAAVRKEVMLAEGWGFSQLESMSLHLGRVITATPLPPLLGDALDTACRRLAEGREHSLCLRSSAVGEDTASSFAGLYSSELGVSPDQAVRAYRQVVTSLYSPRALAYRRQGGLRDEEAEMAVLIQPLVSPRVSGVMYTQDPLDGGRGRLLVSAVPGLGKGLVDGSLDPDDYWVERGASLTLAEVRRGARPGPGEEAPLLADEQVLALARLGLALEELFGCPQDVEWALDQEGDASILQSRPLLVWEGAGGDGQAPVGADLIVAGGQTARPGAAAGRAHRVTEAGDLAQFPAGGILVAQRSSPALAAVLPRAAALVTEIGGVAGHLASLAREFGVPALVGVPGALGLIKPGQVITVDAGAGRIYAGEVPDLVAAAGRGAVCRPPSGPAPAWHAALTLITRLHLTDPAAPWFTPAGCRSFHDIIRYCHEMSFKEMFRLGDQVGAQAGSQARRLDLRLPFQLWAVDLGGGLAGVERGGAGLAQVVSPPGQALLQGLCDPAVDWRRPRPVSLGGLASVFSASLLTPPRDGGERGMGERAYLILGRHYVNFNCRVGYHFTALDSWCGDNQSDNYLSFRFHGGAATQDRRQRRAELVARICRGLGCEAEVSGDAVRAFVKKLDAEATLALLAEMGRLILFTRQMDMLMDSPQMVAWLAEAFRQGDYNLAATPGPGAAP